MPLGAGARRRLLRSAVAPGIRPARPIAQQIREFEIAISVFDVLRCDPRLDLGHYWPLMNVARTIGSCSPCSSTGYVADCTRSAIPDSPPPLSDPAMLRKIGRASCRERGWTEL